MWTLILRTVKLCLLIGAWTLVTYLSLALLMSSYVEPVRGVFSTDPVFRQHGEPVINCGGVIAWLLVIMAYSAGTAWFTKKWFGLSRMAGLGLCVGVLLMTAAYLTVIHPTFLLAILGLDRWRAYVGFIEPRIPLLGAIYGHWGLYRLKFQVLFGQVALSTAICFLAAFFGRRRRPG